MSKVLDRVTINTLSYEERVQYFLKRASEVHGDKYDYSNMNYVRNKEKIDITCNIHGVFKQTPHDHVRGRGCPDCGGKKKSNTEEFIKKATDLYGDKYNYRYVKYINVSKKIKIECRKHGIFEQRPDMHLKGEGCKICNNQYKCTNDFIQKAQEIHGDKFDYSNTIYANNETKISIICKNHGPFLQSVKHHYEGKGCPKCVNKISKPELEVISIIMDLLPNELIETSISPEWMPGKREVDIYIPGKKFAIEYNGDYWHSEKFGRGKEYHVYKSNQAKNAGITLLHVWDSRWNSDYRSIYMDIIDKVIAENVEEVQQLIDDNIWIAD